MALGRKIALIILLFAGLAASCYVAGQRMRIEAGNKSVEIVLDYAELQQMTASMGKNITDVLSVFKTAGATSIAVNEETFGDAIENNIVIPVNNTIYAVTPAQGPVIAKHLQMALPLIGNRIKYILKPGPVDHPEQAASYLQVPSELNPVYLRQIPIGFPQSALKAAKKVGLEPVARLINYSGATPAAINSIMSDVKSLGIKKVIFQGDQILGFKGAVDDTAAALANNDLDFGRVEFSKQKGETTLAEKAKDRIIIVHSINQLEMLGLDMPSVVERFARGVRERGVRMCYVRMFNSASNDIIGVNADYISKVAKGIQKEGCTLGSAKTLADVAAPKYMRILAGVGVAAGVMLLFVSIIDLSPIATILWALLIFGVCAGMAAMGDMGRKVVGLLSAIVFPTLAAALAIRCTAEPAKPASKPLLKGIGRLIYAVATVSAGGLLIVGLLSERSFMLRVDQFAGVKVAHLLPVVILTALFAGGIGWTSETWGVQKRRIIRKFKELGANPVLMWQAIGTLAVLVLVGVMVARSGNDSGMGVSPLEMKFRSILDKILFVRPRTKEFLIGYPLLLTGIVFALRGYKQWAAPLVVVGTIGLVSALNTFCHLHTPLMISALRIVNGTVVGALFGIVLYLILKNLPKPVEE